MGWLDSVLPTPAKLYMDSVLLGKKEPITEADFTPEELAAMQQMIAKQKAAQGGITYADYDPSSQPGLSGLLSPGGRVATSLGQFDYQSDPEGTTITDKYDFNPIFKDESALINVLQALKTGGFSVAHLLGEYVLPPDKGRKARIRIPRR